MEEKIRKTYLLTGRKNAQDNFHMYYKSIYTYPNSDAAAVTPLEYKCRFCGTTDRQKFKKGHSHTFPYFTGNRSLISNDECKSCNNFFGVQYEDALGKFSYHLRSLHGMRGKEGAIKFKTQLLEVINDLKSVNIRIKTNNFNGNNKVHGEASISLDFVSNEEKIAITIPGAKYIPLYLFKSLAKIAFSVMPTGEFENNEFVNFTSWLLQKDKIYDNDNYAPLLDIFHNRLPYSVANPLLVLFKKRSSYQDNNMPTYSFFFGFGNMVFQIFIPYFNNDEHLLGKDLSLPIIPELIINKQNKGNFVWLKGSSLEPVQTNEFILQYKKPI